MRRPFAPLSLAVGATLLCATALVALADRTVEVTRTSRPVRLLRSWNETVKTPGGEEVSRHVEVIVDYAAGQAYERFTNSGGPPAGSRRVSIGAPAPSPEEIAEAFALVRSAPELALIFKRFKVVLEGGFILQEAEGQPCGPDTRCLHVFLLSSDRSCLIRRVVVDLSRLRLAYSLYMPPLGRFE